MRSPPGNGVILQLLQLVARFSVQNSCFVFRGVCKVAEWAEPGSMVFLKGVELAVRKGRKAVVLEGDCLKGRKLSAGKFNILLLYWLFV